MPGGPFQGSSGIPHLPLFSPPSTPDQTGFPVERRPIPPFLHFPLEETGLNSTVGESEKERNGFMINVILAVVLAAPLMAGGNEKDREAKAVVAEFISIYNRKTATHEERISAIRRLARIPHKKTGRILECLLLSPNEPQSEKIEAAIVLCNFSGVKGASDIALKGLLFPVNSTNTKLRIALIRTIRSLGEKRKKDLAILHRLVMKDKDVAVARAAVEVIPFFENRGSVKVLIDYLRKCERKPSRERLTLPIPRQPDRSDHHGVTPQEGRRDFALKISPDEKQAFRYDLCCPALKTALRTMTGNYYKTWKEWDQWWKRGGRTGR